MYKIALFIDCENISHKFLPNIIKELENYGQILIKRAFNDWSKNSGWSGNFIEKYSIEPIQIFNKTGKNSVDLRMVRDILEIKNKPHINAICIASSDSDFRDLILSLKGDGFKVFGFGESKTMQSIQDSYDIFKCVFDENLAKSENKVEKVENEQDLKTKLLKTLKEAIATSKFDGYCLVSHFGQFIQNKKIKLKPKDFGSATWSKAFAKFDEIKVEYLEKNGKKDTAIVSLKS